MQPLRYSINLTLDGCCDHMAVSPDKETHQFHTTNMEEAGALLCGRVIYQMMEEAWREPAETGVIPDWMQPWMESFAKAIHAKKKYVVSNTLDRVDWNAELLSGDLESAVRQVKSEANKPLMVGGRTLPLALAELGLIDEYEFVVHPVVAGKKPTLLAGLSKPLELNLVNRMELDSGVVVMRYEPRS